jgi:hypothetical protein
VWLSVFFLFAEEVHHVKSLATLIDQTAKKQPNIAANQITPISQKP